MSPPGNFEGKTRVQQQRLRLDVAAGEGVVVTVPVFEQVGGSVADGDAARWQACAQSE